MTTPEQIERWKAKLANIRPRSAAALPTESPVAPAPAPAPIPQPEWPAWAKLAAKMKSPADHGVGDTVARMVGPKCSAAFKAWHKATFGADCGCGDRQARWNVEYPYFPPKNR